MLVSEQLAAARADYVQTLENELARILEQLSRIEAVQRVVLFGSYAEGRRDLFTDLDLLVVMDSNKDFVTRTADIYSRLQVRVDVDLLVYTPEELNRMEHSGFMRRVLESGKVLYEKNPEG